MKNIKKLIALTIIAILAVFPLTGLSEGSEIQTEGEAVYTETVTGDTGSDATGAADVDEEAQSSQDDPESTPANETPVADDGSSSDTGEEQAETEAEDAGAETGEIGGGTDDGESLEADSEDEGIQDGESDPEEIGEGENAPAAAEADTEEEEEEEELPLEPVYGDVALHFAIDGELWEGTEISMVPVVPDEIIEYTTCWEMLTYDEFGNEVWNVVCGDFRFTIELNEENNSHSYRLVVVESENGRVHYSIPFVLPEYMPLPQETEDVYAPEKTVKTKSVQIFSSRSAVMKPGEVVILTSVLTGFEDCEEIIYQWECDMGDGFEPLEGANSDSYQFVASVETLSWGWKLTVYFR